MRPLAFLVALTWSSPVHAQDAWRAVYPGVEHADRVEPGLQNINILKVDLCAPGVSVRATASGERGQTVSGFGSSVGAQAAINGDFFVGGYATHGPAMSGGAAWPDGGPDNTATALMAFGSHQLELLARESTAGIQPWMNEVVSGYPVLLTDGDPIDTNYDPLCTDRHPRTAVGFTADRRTLFLVTVDGRASTRIGMPCDELRSVFISLGATTAINLDGGGSTAMWLASEGVMNFPSDGSQRVVGNHLAIYASGAGDAPNCPNLAPQGFLDGASCEGVSGWAQDETVPDDPIDVHVYFGGQAGDQDAGGVAVTADDRREDLCEAIGSCAHGYSVPVPYAFRDHLSHEVWAYGIDSEGGENPLLAGGPLSVTCDPPPMPVSAELGRLRAIATPEVMAAWGFSALDVAVPGDDVLADYRVAAPLLAAPDLVQLAADQPLYLIDDGPVRRVIRSQEVAAAWAFEALDVRIVSAGELAALPEGDPLPAAPFLVRGDSGDTLLVDAPDGAGDFDGADDASDPSDELSVGCGCASGGGGRSGGLLALLALAGLLGRAGRRAGRRRPRVVAPTVLAWLAMAAGASTAAAVCYRQPFDNPNLEDGWGSTLPPRTNPHRGLDYPQAAGTPIPAIGDGVVVSNTWSDCLGHVVVLRHADGMYSGYNHMITASPLAVGTEVVSGQAVGEVGDSGTCSFGAHLHLTVAPAEEGNFYGTTIDPFPFIEDRSESSDTCQQGRLLEQTDAYAGPRTTDVDGDGRADLCARDSSGFRCWVARSAGWQPPWAPIPWSDDAGWGDVANYATLRMGDLDGDGRADVCARSDTDVLCALSTGSGFAAPTVWRPDLSDAGGWGLPQYYTTLRLADVDGDGRDDLCARDAAGFGCWLSDGSAFTSPVAGPAWSDAAFVSPRYYGTLRMGDLDGDGRADACIRGAAGVECARSEGSGFTGVLAGPAWSDESGWGGMGYWSTIRLADVDGDGRDDLCARSSADLRCLLATDDGFGETLIVGELSDASGWGDRANYTSLRSGDIDGDGAADLCARGDDGMGCWGWNGEAFVQRGGPAWSDASGWGAGGQYYQSIRVADFDGDGRADLCARAGAGWRCAPSTGDGFADEITIDDLTDAGGWGEPRYWSTIVSAGQGAAKGDGPSPPGDGVGGPLVSGCSASGGHPATWLALTILVLVAVLGRRRGRLGWCLVGLAIFSACSGLVTGGEGARREGVDGGDLGSGDAASDPGADAQPVSFTVPRIDHRGLANPNWGYPAPGDARRLQPTILMVVHMFGVEDTAAMPVGIDPGTGTNQEYTAISKPSHTGTSAHDYIARNGEVIEVIDPAAYAAWSNGFIDNPNRSIATIDAIASQSTYNPNEFCYREVENTGYPDTYEVTEEQKETVAYFVALDSIATGLDIDRSTVTTHADFDSVNRPRCAFPPADREAALAHIIDRALVIRAEMLATP